jgi:hypothetical protein
MDRRQLTDQVKVAARNAGFELVGLVSMGPATDDPPMPWLR